VEYKRTATFHSVKATILSSDIHPFWDRSAGIASPELYWYFEI